MAAQKKQVLLDGSSLTPDLVGMAAGRKVKVHLASRAVARMRASRRVVERAAQSGRTAYGINTGFGHLAMVRIPPEDVRLLQVNLVRSHAAAVGPPAAPETVRALLVLRANVLARGHSGVRPEVAGQLLALLAADLLPVVPEQGSVGASGDLAPLAHVALAAIGEGEVFFRGRRRPAGPALAAAGLRPLTLQAKEGLALVNGTQFTAALGCLALLRAENLVTTADVAAALSLETLQGTTRAFDDRIGAVRPHAGQRLSAGNLHRLLAGSPIGAAHADCPKVQDAYSLRCTPQVHGAVRDALAQLRRVLTVEINSSTDNPLVFAAERDIVSGGNFHAAPLAAALDYAALAAATLASISERRIDRVVNPLVSGLPAFLAGNPGLESGLMMAQVSAAALVSECKTLAHPGSVDSIPTSANQEDHVSMAPWCARKFDQILERVETVLAIEFLAGMRGLAFHRPRRSTPALERVARLLSREVPLPSGDFPPSPAITSLAALVGSGRVVEAAAGKAGPPLF